MDNQTWEYKIHLRVVVRNKCDETGESVPHGPPAGSCSRLWVGDAIGSGPLASPPLSSVWRGWSLAAPSAWEWSTTKPTLLYGSGHPSEISGFQ